jgi:hypothetical protein
MSLPASILGILLIASAAFGADWTELESELDPGYRTRNMVSPFRDLGEAKDLPLRVEPYVAHVNGGALALPSDRKADAVATIDDTVFALSGSQLYRLSGDARWQAVVVNDHAAIHPDLSQLSPRVKLLALAAWSRSDGLASTIADEDLGKVNDVVGLQGQQWFATDEGLFSRLPGEGLQRHNSYGAGGPLATKITALAADGNRNLWAGTPIGLSVRDAKGQWRSFQGRDGLPCEDVTSIAVDHDDNLWIGTGKGVIHYRPQSEGRQWFYRAGPRYLPHDQILSLALSSDGRSLYAATPGGVGMIEIVHKTLRQKADNIEALVNKRHRRMGMVASCNFLDPDDLSQYVIHDSDNDGLWTAYHVSALSLAYGTTQDAAHKASAKVGMHALYMLQNASGIPGLTARSVILPEAGLKKREEAKDELRLDRREQWRPTPDGSLYWKSDTSSDEYCGHYMAFYAYWEHIAQYNPEERDLCIKQVRQTTDYLLENNYQLIDWDGEHTTWGFWNPEILNEDPGHYIESGLNALHICSMLNTAYYITGDGKYRRHYLKLIQEHDYLSNILTMKKLFPDEVNHSDDQLGFTSWYPILQTEQDPKIRRKLHQAVRRHWTVEAPERSSYFTFVYATIDPNHADIKGAVQNLIEIPEDRRTWRIDNSSRADVTFDPRNNRFDWPVLRECLPADERDFQKWNGDPFLPGGGDAQGMSEDDGAAFLLPYWMGRYHGFFTDEVVPKK